jgi:hypothetical protein
MSFSIGALKSHALSHSILPAGAAVVGAGFEAQAGKLSGDAVA